jgi:hypothetical protein
MLDALISAMEASLVHFNLWSYNPMNRNDVGDDWNAESFSWYSEDNRKRELAAMSGSEAAVQAQNPDVGGRLLDVLVRPYAIATSGQPLSSTYDRTNGFFSLRYREKPGCCDLDNPPLERVTEIFLPTRIYGATGAAGVKWNLSQGGNAYFDSARQRLFVWFSDTDEIIHYRADITRRVDLWVSDATDPKGLGSFALMACAFLTLFVLLNELSRHFIGAYFVDLPQLQ